jgi:hypothetical protein
MAQHDYILANQSGAAFRSDLNNGLAAIVSNNSGVAQPSTTYAYQWWSDTTTGLLKLRNAANNAWITIGTLADANLGLLSLAGGTLTGALLVDDSGTAALPAIAFDGDPDSGIFRGGANEFGIATNGVERVEFGTTEVVFNDGGADVDFRVEGDTNPDLFKIDAGLDEVQVANLNGGPLAGTRNRIINGDMRIDQRNAGASVTPTVDNQYVLDRWRADLSVSSKYSVQQNAGGVTPSTGFTNYLGVTSLSAYAISASDYFMVEQVVEGFNVSDLGWGSASATAVTLSFKVRSSLTGTFGGSVMNSAANRSYPFTYSISTANTWETKTVTISGDTTGTWVTGNGIGIRLFFGLGVGATNSGTAGAWAAAGYLGATGATSVVGTSGATFYITGVQLEPGSTATPLERRSYGQELSLAKRYYQLGGGLGAVYQGGATATFSFQAKLEPEMRAAPTASVFNGTTAVVQNGRTYANINSISLVINSTSQSVYMTVVSSDTGMTSNASGEVSGRAIAFTSEL